MIVCDRIKISEILHIISGTPASSQASSNSSAPAHSGDPAWNYGSIHSTKKNHTKRSFCDRVIKGGGITRFKKHLGGLSGEVAACKPVSHDDKWKMERLVMENRKNKTKKKKAIE